MDKKEEVKANQVKTEKTIYKKWWFIVGSIVIIIGIIVALIVIISNKPYQGIENKKDTSLEIEETENKKDVSSKKEETFVVIKESPDKYTWYIKNYVGRNCNTLGYTSLGGSRLEKYGASTLELIFITPNGKYIDIKKEEELKKYVVVGQNLEPNTELKLTYQKDSNGKEYDSLIDTKSYDEIVLTVEEVGSSEKNKKELSTIKPAPDKYTRYIYDYVGRNLNDCGYISLGGDLLSRYANATIKMSIITDDGSYVDLKDEELIKNYVVTEQNVSPNTELKLTYQKDSNGKEYDSLIEHQNIEEIEIKVKKINN